MDIRGILGMERVLFSADYDGHRVTITQKGSVRTLKCDELIYSRIDSGSPHTHEYWDFFSPLAYLRTDPEVLMIGLGGGTIAFQFGKILGNGFVMDIVELDRRMADIYPRFLGSTVGCRITIGDGGTYVAAHKQAYDVIILDAYQPDSRIPEHFLRQGFVEDAYNSLTECGVLAVNCIGSMIGPGLDSFIQNLAGRFEVYRLDTHSYTANVVLVCMKNISKDELLKAISKNIKESSENGFLLTAYRNAKRVFLTL